MTMRVVIASTSDGTPGAFAAAYRLHVGLTQGGANSLMLVSKKNRDFPNIIGPNTNLQRFWSKAAPRLEKVLAKKTISASGSKISPAWVLEDTASRINILKPDIINLHWINNGFLRPESFVRLNKPIVWTLHDMWAFCGGEHYTGECVRYREGYLSNNRPPSERGWDINRWVWRRKLRAWAKIENLTIVTPSHWLAHCAGESILFKGRRVEVIPNGVDHLRFHPVNHNCAREILGLPKDKKLILFGAVNATSDQRKGFHLLRDALRELSINSSCRDVELVIFGTSSGADEEHFGLKCHYLGKFKDEMSLGLVYAAADVFVAPSLQDNLPNTVVESLACGTPVVAFNIGGMPDMINHQLNGCLAKPFDIKDFAEGVRWVISDAERWTTLSQNARQTVEDRFTLEIQAQKYLRLFNELL